jgi:hypothetical protein
VSKIPANDEMVSGYMDGFNLDVPNPSENRRRSYRHGFANGRSDKTGQHRGFSCGQLERMADTAMAADAMNSMDPTP